MNTNNKSSQNNNFIYALGMICLLNILSTEFKMEESNIKKEVGHTCIIPDCAKTSNLFI